LGFFRIIAGNFPLNCAGISEASLCLAKEFGISICEIKQMSIEEVWFWFDKAKEFMEKAQRTE
jgi:hypothetical protein